MIPSLIVLVVATSIVFVWYERRTRRVAVERLSRMIGKAGDVEDRAASSARVITSFPRRHRIAAYAAGIVSGALLWLVAGVPLPIAIAAGVLAGVLTHLVEEHIGGEKTDVIEAQLASSIYLMVGSLRAGASLLAAFESALEEVGPPLRPYFQEVAGRIRLGDDPRGAVGALQVHVPIETFRLFATSLAVHWEVGGSLATTLSSVGQTVRDRIELSRRVRAQAVEAQASVAVVLVMAYVLGFLMWRTNPDRLEAFIGTSIGTSLVAAVILLQAVGLIWMSKLNRSAF
ncbi:MAG TPA: type II secretion system F family protein [Vicinamibacterales bacterium]|nr:type II secretion system F family protein [Vicinamibacterales bacterium]